MSNLDFNFIEKDGSYYCVCGYAMHEAKETDKKKRMFTCHNSRCKIAKVTIETCFKSGA